MMTGINVAMEKKKASTQSRKIKIEIKDGDVLLLPQSNGKYSLALVLGLWPNLESVMTIALLAKEITKDLPSAEELTELVRHEFGREHLMSILSTTTGTAEAGEWLKIGAVRGIDISHLLPEKPFKTGSLVGCKYEGAPLVEGLIEAYRGFVDWDGLLAGRPGYLKGLVYTPKSAA